MPSMGSGGNSGARNRQRNLSMGSNTSSATYKENRENLSNTSDHMALPSNWNVYTRNPVRAPEPEAGIYPRRYYTVDSNTNVENVEPEPDFSLHEKKWHYENLLSQLESMNIDSLPSIDRPVPRMDLQPGSRTQSSSRLAHQAASLKETQQRLGRLQEIMKQNAPNQQLHDTEVQNNYRFLGSQAESSSGQNPVLKDFPNLLRNFSQNCPSKRLFPVRPLLNQSSNQSFEMPQHRPLSPQQSGTSLREMFLQREQLLASSTEGSEQGGEFQESHTQNGMFFDQQGSSNVQLQTLQDRLSRTERELEKMSFVCDILLREQRDLASTLDSLVSVMSSSSDPFSSHRFSADSSAFTHQQILLTLNQCCHLLLQLQRDLSAVSNCVFSRSSNQPASPASGGLPSFEIPHRQDPSQTLNNQVPPGTRTNNYWDNFRSYSRQNLLSSSSSKGAQTAAAAFAVATATATAAETQENSITVPVSPPAVASQDSRTKRKVNKGQRQVEIGVHSPHADNRALAYGLMSFNSSGTQPDVTTRNLNPRAGNETTVAASVDVKIVKDTSGLMYSGARPKENRRPHNIESAALEITDAEENETKPQNASLEQDLHETLHQHSSNPRFLAELLQLVKKFDDDKMRESQNPLVAAFHSSVAANSQYQGFFLPQFLENFLSGLQHEPEEEGAAAALPLKSLTLPSETVEQLRVILTPFVGQPLAEIQQHIAEILSKVTFCDEQKEESRAACEASASIDDLAEADQVCETGSETREMQANILDEVPIRLMSGMGQNSWFTEDQVHDN